MSASSDGSLALTTDGTLSGRLQAVVTTRDLAPVFGDQPGWILQQIARADDPSRLRALNHRARAFVLRHLSSPSSVDWLARFTHAVDAGIVARLIVHAGAADLDACWCVAGAAGRSESLTRLAPHLVVIGADGESPERILDAHVRVEEALEACGYLPRETADAGVHAALLADWQARYLNWVRDPVRAGMYRARPLFDLRPVAGNRPLWERLRAAAIEPIDTAFLYVLANDCLGSLPPLTFFQDAVVEESGEQTSVFRLEESVLGPLVDVGRVFGLAARTMFGRSTLERLATARSLFPEHAAIFRESAETFRTVLWQQGRVGISQGTGGFELPPDLLSRYDRQVLKSGFRSILRLLEFTADPAWLEKL
jgi:CBS domain-containing protein